MAENEDRYSWYYNTEKNEYIIVSDEKDEIGYIIEEIDKKFVVFLNNTKIKSFETKSDAMKYLKNKSVL